MSSSNNTLESDDGNSTTEKESLPTTTSVLDKSRSLFGNSSSVLSAPRRDPTPEFNAADSSVTTSEPAVAMDADGESKPVSDASSSAKEESATSERSPEPAIGQKEEITDEEVNTIDRSEPPAEVEEVFQKKVVSMDTSADNGDTEESLVVDEKDEEYEEEVSKEKVKTSVTHSDENDVTEEPEKGVSSAPEEIEENVEEEAKEEQNDCSASEEVEKLNERGLEEIDAVSDVLESSHEDSEKANEVPDNQKKSPEDLGQQEELNQDPSSSTRSLRSKRTTSTATPSSSSTTPARGGRGRRSNVKGEEEDSNPIATETPMRRGRSSRGGHKEDIQEDEKAPEGDQEVSGTEEKSSRRGRSKRSTAEETVADEHENSSGVASHESPENEEQEAAPKRGGRGKQSGLSSAVSTPHSTRGRGKKSQANDDSAATDEKEETSAKPIRAQRNRKSATKKDAENEGEEGAEEDVPEAPISSRRSTRAKAQAKSAPVTPAVSSKRTAAHGRKKKISFTEEAAEEATETVETPPLKKGRAAKSAPSSSNKKDEFDPYDLDTEMEHHPEPLRNIHMEVQNFGAVRYGKVGTSESKYYMTEKAAESRIADLQASPASKNRRSLADMTPGKEKLKHRMPAGTGNRKTRAKKVEPDQDDVEMEDVSQTKSDPSSSPVPSNRGRKRKSEPSDVKNPPAKREPEVVLYKLSDEEQLKVDHPPDDNEPHAPGARVYAIFQKTFYPAVIMSERDGLGRYKLQFTADKVIKDVPNSGIIPLRALCSGKTAIYNEEDVRLDSGPNDISAEEWTKGKVTITLLDDDGEPTDDVKSIDWKDISFDQAEWRDYVRDKEHSATAIVTSNITTISEASRARKPTAITQPSKVRGRKKKDAEYVSSSGASVSPVDGEEEKILPMKEEAIGKNIFAGKVFMLTSANRHNPTVTQPMFKKKNLMNFITQHGGIVTEQLDERFEAYEQLLVSDTYYRTHKYLAALASGIPCISNTWLQVCGEKGECVDYSDYVLPAGASIFDESQDMPAPSNPSELLKGTSIFVHSTHSAREVTQTGRGGTFIEIWKPILEMLGASVVDGDWKKLNETKLKFDVVLVDGTFRDEVMKYSDKIGASKVTSEWVIQTIILGKAPKPTAHPKFDPYRLHNRE